MSTKLALALASLVLGAGACGSSKPQLTPPASSGSATTDGSCPAAVPGTSIAAEDTDTGGALVFVTTGDVAELRKRVAAMATSHNERHAAMGAVPTGTEGGEHAGHDMSGHDMSEGGMIMFHSTATAVDIEGGARLVFTAAAADVANLQRELRMHARHLANGTCSMASGPQVVTGPAADPEPAEPDAATVKAQLIAAETAAYQQAKPVFDRYCAKCHSKDGKSTAAKKRAHFDMTTYPFGGHHAAELGKTIRKSLGIDGSKPTMPFDDKGAVQGDELAAIAAWADAFDAAHAAGAHADGDGDGDGDAHEHGEHEHGHGDHAHDH